MTVMIIQRWLILTFLVLAVAITNTIHEPHEEHAHKQHPEGRERRTSTRDGAIARRLATVHVGHVGVRDVGDGDGHFLVLWDGHGWCVDLYVECAGFYSWSLLGESGLVLAVDLMSDMASSAVAINIKLACRAVRMAS